MNDMILSLISALGDQREGLRQFAIKRLLDAGDEAIPHLINALRYKNPLQQEGIAIVLATLGTNALPALRAAMRHEDRAIRWGAAWVISSMPEECRATLPKVRIPGSAEEAAPPSASGLQYAVWSDSWLTKIRERLNTNRVADVITLAANDPQLGHAHT